MRIALFHEVASGGARRGANEFAKALRTKGHSVDLFIVDEKKEDHEDAYYDVVRFYQFIPKKWKGKNWKTKLYKDTIELYTLYLLHKKIARDIEEKAYDFAFIHPSQYTQAPFLLRFLSLPKLYYCQEPLRMIYEKEFDQTKSLDFVRQKYERIIRKVRKAIDRKNIFCADVIFANSTFTQKNILEAYNLSSIVCHMGVDAKRFYAKRGKKDIDILYIGSEDPIDGYDVFMQSMRFLKTKPKIEYLLRGKKWLSDDEQLLNYYNRAKIVICFGKNEPFGLVPLEAMACGAVVIALDRGGYVDSVLQGKTGLRVRQDPRKIADAINTLLQNDMLLQAFAKAAKKEVQKNWQWSKSTECILESFSLWQKNQ